MVENRLKKDIGIGLFFFVLSICYFIGTFSVESYSPFGQMSLSSKTIPQILALIMAALSLLVLVPSCLKALKSEKTEEKAKTGSKRISTGIIKFFIAVALLFVYTFCFSRAGFIVSTMFYLFFMVWMLLPHKTKRNVILTFVFSVVISVLIYTIFNKFLGLILPGGILGF